MKNQGHERSLTLGELLKQLQALSPDQLRQKAFHLESLTGRWSEIEGLRKATKARFQKGEEPGSESAASLECLGVELTPVITRGQIFIRGKTNF